jgi:hypothetical protein
VTPRNVRLQDVIIVVHTSRELYHLLITTLATISIYYYQSISSVRAQQKPRDERAIKIDD